MKNIKCKILLSSLVMCSFLTTFTVKAESYLVITKGKITNSVKNQIKKAGGKITDIIDEAGVLVVESDNKNFEKRMPTTLSVMPNIKVRMIPEVDVNQDLVTQAANPPNSNDDDYFFDHQWGHDAVNAPEAWEAGARGAGSLVAVLDSGFSPLHDDLAPNVVGTMDFTGEGIEYGPNEGDPGGVFSHGNHVAGTIAAADNGMGTIGVAPDAKLLLVKVLGNLGSGSFANIFNGIIYAANYPGVDIINMSLGADIPQGLGADASDVAALRTALTRAMSFARRQGITIIVAAGNDARDLDKDKSMVVFPAGLPNAISISATGPEGWAVDPTTDLDTQAIYTNYGRSGIDFAAPGGDYEVIYNDPDVGFQDCGGRPCYVFDFVFSTGSNYGANWYFWSVGTSMAAPHAAGVAAIIVGENGGDMKPSRLEAEMRSRADDLGQPGNDPLYGAGRVSTGY